MSLVVCDEQQIAFTTWHCRPPHGPIVSAGSTATRPSRCAVVMRALKRRPRPEGPQLSRRTGEEQGTAISAGRSPVRHAISVPLTPVTNGLPRSLADTRPAGQAA